MTHPRRHRQKLRSNRSCLASSRPAHQRPAARACRAALRRSPPQVATKEALPTPTPRIGRVPTPTPPLPPTSPGSRAPQERSSTKPPSSPEHLDPAEAPPRAGDPSRSDPPAAPPHVSIAGETRRLLPSPEFLAAPAASSASSVAGVPRHDRCLLCVKHRYSSSSCPLRALLRVSPEFLVGRACYLLCVEHHRSSSSCPVPPLPARGLLFARRFVGWAEAHASWLRHSGLR